jgi:hypothetical protein
MAVAIASVTATSGLSILGMLNLGRTTDWPLGKEDRRPNHARAPKKGPALGKSCGGEERKETQNSVGGNPAQVPNTGCIRLSENLEPS